MLSVAIIEPGKVELVDIPEPHPGPYEARIRTEAVCLCNATDRKLIEGHFPGVEKYPLLLGHETVGIVDAVDFARRCVDSGADAVLMHGSHVLRGIELHRGKPILYGLGNFVYQANLVERLPADAFEKFDLPEDAGDEAVFARFEQLSTKAGTPTVAGRSPHLVGSAYSVLARLRLARRGPGEIRLHPLTLGPERSREQCGYPRLATGPVADEILRLMRDLSAPFGTTVVPRNGCGVVTLASRG